MKNKLFISSLVVLSFTIGFGANNIKSEKENNSDKIEIETVLDESENINNVTYDNISDSYNEHDVFVNKNGVRSVPVKAIASEDHFVMTDLYGEIHVVYDEELKDGQNYVMVIGNESEKIYDIIESSFTFTYEELFQDEELMNEEVKLIEENELEEIFRSSIEL